MLRILAVKRFRRWAQRQGLNPAALLAAVEEMRRGLIDADLGGGLVKKRIGLRGRGKRGGARSIVATNKSSRWYFLYGFAKNEREAISELDLVALRAYAGDLLALTTDEIAHAIAEGELIEVSDGHVPTKQPHP
jgi:hypothetical protein